MFGPRGVLRCKATDQDDPTEQPRWGRSRQAGHRRHRSTYEETDGDDRRRDVGRGLDYIKRQAAAGKPFFCWYNSTRMHLRMHVAPQRRRTGSNRETEYRRRHVEHDGHVGKVLKALDDPESRKHHRSLYN